MGENCQEIARIKIAIIVQGIEKCKATSIMVDMGYKILPDGSRNLLIDAKDKHLIPP